MTTIATIAAALAAAVLLAVSSGCGGSSSSSGGATTTTGTTATTVSWANGLCSATTAWQGALESAASSLKNSPSKGAVKSAATQVKQATTTYLDALKGLGRPDVQAGQDARTQVDKLQSQLQGGVDTMQKATEGVSGANGVLQAVSTVSGTLATMGSQVRSTVSSLQKLDAKGELQQAFSQANACSGLTRK